MFSRMSINLGHISIVLVDDHPIFLDGLTMLLNKINPESFKIIGRFCSGDDMLAELDACIPDVIFTDIQMPGLGGIEVTTQVKKRSPSVKVIALSTFNDRETVTDMLKAGADGYLLKSATKEEIALAVTTTCAGGTFFSEDRGVQEALRHYLEQPGPKLSQREKILIGLVSQEYCNKEIADNLSISIRSVETYRERIMKKLGSKNFIGVVMYAVKNHIIKL